MSTTILDQLMHHCHLLEFDGRSYRLKEAAEALAQGNKVKSTCGGSIEGFLFTETSDPTYPARFPSSLSIRATKAGRPLRRG